MLGTKYVTRQVAALLDYAKSTLIEQSRRLVRQSLASRTALDREAKLSEVLRQLNETSLSQLRRDHETGHLGHKLAKASM